MLFMCILGGLAAAQTSTPPELRSAAATMTPGNLLRHIRELSSDAYDGRLPGTRGEEKSVAYVISQIEGIGLQPGTPSGGFVQKVPLYGTRSRGSLAITAGGKGIPMSPAEDFVLWSNLPDERIEVRDSDAVFVGYGVVAPEFKWNDYVINPIGIYLAPWKTSRFCLKSATASLKTRPSHMEAGRCVAPAATVTSAPRVPAGSTTYASREGAEAGHTAVSLARSAQEAAGPARASASFSLT